MGYQKNLSQDSKNFKECLEYFGLEQLNLNPSRRDCTNILDLVITNMSDLISPIVADTFPFDSDHFSLDFKLKIKWQKVIREPRHVYQGSYTLTMTKFKDFSRTFKA